tara:strand:+ start:16038 stop:16760 length:723 start_codon:yes stop_codon:yes gene_type:complete
MFKKTKYSEDQFVKAVESSFSIAQVSRKIGIKSKGGNYRTVKNKIKALKLDTSHFTGQSYLKGKTHNWAKSIPLKDILVKNSLYTSTNNLKYRLFKEGIFEKKCYNCDIIQWLGEDISFELDHINGDNSDNRKENLTILCPNCHSLTPTYRGRNRKINTVKKRTCKECDKPLSLYYSHDRNQSGLCSPCFNKNRDHSNAIRKVKNRPCREELLQMIEETSYCAVGRKYGVSDNAVRKWLK